MTDLTVVSLFDGIGGFPLAFERAGAKTVATVEIDKPDGWTEGQSGAARYRQLGNSVAVPVVEWIARRMVAVDGAA